MHKIGRCRSRLTFALCIGCGMVIFESDRTETRHAALDVCISSSRQDAKQEIAWRWRSLWSLAVGRACGLVRWTLVGCPVAGAGRVACSDLTSCPPAGAQNTSQNQCRQVPSTLYSCNGINDCVRARSCRERIRKRHIEYDILRSTQSAGVSTWLCIS